MALDFAKLGSRNGKEPIIEPRQVFSTLPNKDPRFKFLHDVQGSVMEAWFNRRNEKDLVLKMNTGSGKTLTGLIILQSSINEGQGPAVYVAPDKFLVDQVIKESKYLGVNCTEDPHSPDFNNLNSILVINAYRLFNGLSVFGVGDNGKKIEIGSVIIDDVHACLNSIRDQFSIKLSANHPAYQTLFDRFKPDLEKQSAIKVLDVQEHDPQTVMSVPYWTWQDHHLEIAKDLHLHRDTDALRFTWPLVSGVLNNCNCAIGRGYIEIAPRCLPTDTIPSFCEANRRIYMTATLADDSVLVTDLQANPDSVSKPITPGSASDIGDRMILAPQEINPDTTDEEIRQFVANISKHRNVVVIVPSFARGELWKKYADQTLSSDAIVDGVSKLKEGKHIGLTVLIRRYDGIDLPDEACRLLVIDGLPEVRNLLDQIEANQLADTDIELSRHIQRIEQGMGRGVRSNDDYCVVLLVGSRLVQRLNSVRARTKFTPGTLAQIDLSKDVTDQVSGQSLDELNEVIELCLNQDPEWVATSKTAVVGAKFENEVVLNSIAVVQRQAFDLMRKQQVKRAAEAIQGAINSCDDERTRGWLKLQLAEIIHKSDAQQSQEILLSAFTDNQRIIRPIDGITYSKLGAPTSTQAGLVVDYCKPKFLEANPMILWLNSLLSELIFQPNTANKFEETLKILGQFLGFGSQRPESEFGQGPDNLYSIGNLNYLVIECKNGAENALVSKNYCNQLSGSMNWFEANYDATCSATPVMIHPSCKVSKQANPPSGMRIINEDKLRDLRNAVNHFGKTIAMDSGFLDGGFVEDRLHNFNLNSEDFIENFTVEFVSE
ncbi:MAG: DEAD/DEAH box helicase [Rhodospirillaceae bacterium]|nr:DEAD/DEAH box helicase [Rhodospirillaceae bacterium]MBT5048360.1 DEAD/DEAH box helicase [Rhodospirillaceae bacterium]